MNFFFFKIHFSFQKIFLLTYQTPIPLIFFFFMIIFSILLLAFHFLSFSFLFFFCFFQFSSFFTFSSFSVFPFFSFVSASFFLFSSIFFFLSYFFSIPPPLSLLLLFFPFSILLAPTDVMRQQEMSSSPSRVSIDTYCISFFPCCLLIIARNKHPKPDANPKINRNLSAGMAA